MGTKPARIASLDQFRGYTVLGMFLVNFISSFTVIGALWPVLKHHHSYCSYADTIMPQFFFAVGFAYRLTLLRRLEQGDGWRAYGRAVRRNAGLILLAFVIYPLGDGLRNWAELSSSRGTEVLLREFKRNLFQTLTHIGVTSLWVMPVIAAGPLVRCAYAVVSGLLHVGLSYAFNYTWVHAAPVGIDGGPLGFLTWTIPLLAGSLAYDTLMSGTKGKAIRQGLLWGVVLMVLGYGLSCLQLAPMDHPQAAEGLTYQLASPPLVHVATKPPDPNLFTMSQRAGSISYLVFAAGLAWALYALFIGLSDVGGWQIGVLRTVGVNALAGYILHGLVMDAVHPFVPRDAPLWYVAAAYGLFLVICLGFLRFMEKQGLYLRL